jgi:hypothetical protein
MRVQTPTFGGNFFSMILQESRSFADRQPNGLKIRSSVVMKKLLEDHRESSSIHLDFR